MQNKKSIDILKNKKLAFNNVVIVGNITSKGELTSTKLGNIMIKFILNDKAFCIALNENANLIYVIDDGSMLLIEGKLERIDNTNVVVCDYIEIYTTQEEIDTKKYRKELKEEKTKF